MPTIGKKRFAYTVRKLHKVMQRKTGKNKL